VVGFAGELMDGGVTWSGSTNAKMRKPGITKSTTVTQDLLLQQAQGAALLEQQVQATKAAHIAAADTQLLQQGLS
jgi:hypothetical protein